MKKKRIRNHASKSNLYLLFLNTLKVPNFRRKNADVTKTQGVCHVVYMFLGSSLGKI